MMRVYVAGPYSSDPEGNTNRAIDVAESLRRAGLAPFVPHLYRWWDARHPMSYEDVMRMCFAWVSSCHALLRIPGASSGADREIVEAERLDIPVFYSVPALIQWARSREVAEGERCADEDAAEVAVTASAKAQAEQGERALRMLGEAVGNGGRT